MPGQHETDATTLAARRALDGDLDSLGRLMERFGPALLALARHRLAGPLSGHYDPEDLVADTWIRALPRLPDLEPRAGRVTPVMMRFLSTTLVNRYNSLLQKHILGKPKRVDLGDEPDDQPLAALPAAVDGAVTVAARREGQDLLHRAIDELKELDREIVYLRAIEQVPVKDAAEIVGISEGALKNRYARALMRLQTKLPNSVLAELGD